jgi:hypothetical protein
VKLVIPGLVGGLLLAIILVRLVVPWRGLSGAAMEPLIYALGVAIRPVGRARGRFALGTSRGIRRADGGYAVGASAGDRARIASTPRGLSVCSRDAEFEFPARSCGHSCLLRRGNSAVATTVWDRPIIDDFLYAVRDRNRSLPRERRLRILLGDPPIDWRAITSADDYRKVLLRRDSHPADLIRREVLAKGRRALVIYGDGHLAARSERPGQSMVGILETSGVRIFTITSTFADLSRFQSDVASWRTPAIALLKDTLLGAVPLETLISPLPPVDIFKSNPNIEDHHDAVLWRQPQTVRCAVCTRWRSPVVAMRLADAE